MARLLVRDRTTREFEIHETALPFWKDHVEVLKRIPEFGDPVDSPPEESGTPQPSKAAARPAREAKE